MLLPLLSLVLLIHFYKNHTIQLLAFLSKVLSFFPVLSTIYNLQAHKLQKIASSSRGSSRPKDGNCISYVSWIGRWVLYLGSPQKIRIGKWIFLTFILGPLFDFSFMLYPSCFSNLSAVSAKSRQSCPTLCNPIDGSPPGSPVPGIFQARVLEWGAITFSTNLSRYK